jgi:predicted RNA binding protein YcfA (HicA-like mRNA interferase family)
MLTNNKELRRIIKEAEQRGWTFKRSGRGNHIKGIHPMGKTTTISISPSDGRAYLNIVKDLRT